jgi:hypothetical protein
MINKKIIGIFVCMLFFGASVIPLISGEPIGSESNISYGDLGGRTSLSKKILVYATSIDGQYDKTYFDDDLPAILENYGYSIFVTDRISTPEITSSLLSDYDELWFLSTYKNSVAQLSPLEINTILNYRNQGNGLLIMADGNANADYSDDANQISIPLGIEFYGNANHGVNGQPIYPIFNEHPLFSEVNSIAGHESESKMIITAPNEVVATYGSDNLISVLDNGSGRVVYDVSWSRLWDEQILVGDNPQYVRNIADWLMKTENQPPNKPTITGSCCGKPGVEYTYCINASDPDNDTLFVIWNWGDGTNGEWLGPYESGTEVCDSHVWNETGTYNISATIRDEYGASVTVYKEVTMPRDKVIYSSFLRFFENYPLIYQLLQLWLQRFGI